MAQGRPEEDLVVGWWPAGGQVRAACLKLSISQRNKQCRILPCIRLRTLPCITSASKRDCSLQSQTSLSRWMQ